MRPSRWRQSPASTRGEKGVVNPAARMAVTDGLDASTQPSARPPCAPKAWCGGRVRVVALVASLALLLAGLSPVAEAHAEETVGADSGTVGADSGTVTEVEGGGGPPAATPVSSDPGPGGLPASQPEEPPSTPAPVTGDESGPATPVDSSEPSGPGSEGPAETPSLTSGAPEETPAMNIDAGLAGSDAEPPIAAGTGAPIGGRTDAPTAPPGPPLVAAIDPRPTPAALEAIAVRARPKAARNHRPSTAPVTAPAPRAWRVAAPMPGPGQTPFTLPTSSRGGARGSRPVVTEQAQPAPSLPRSIPNSGWPTAADGSMCAASGSCGGSSGASGLMLLTIAMCICVLLFERLVPDATHWRSESFVSLRERPG